MTHPYLSASSDQGTVALNDIAQRGNGAEAQPGVTGLGLPPIEAIFSTGAGEGATYMGRRVGSRTTDVPVTFIEEDREALKATLRAATRVLLGDNLKLHWHEEGRPTYSVRAAIVGGGDYVYGTDTEGNNWARCTYTFQTEDALWESDQEFTGTTGINPESSGSAYIEVDNTGGAPTYPTFKVTGPTGTFTLQWGEREFLQYQEPLAQGQQVTIETSTGKVVDRWGTNRYGDLGPLPSFGPLPEGESTVYFAFQAQLPQPSAMNHFMNPRALNNLNYFNVPTGYVDPGKLEMTPLDTGGNWWIWKQALTQQRTVGGESVVTFYPQLDSALQKGPLTALLDESPGFTVDNLTPGTSYKLILQYRRAKGESGYFIAGPPPSGSSGGINFGDYENAPSRVILQNGATSVIRSWQMRPEEQGVIEHVFAASGPQVRVGFAGVTVGGYWSDTERVTLGSNAMDVLGVAVVDASSFLGYFDGDSVVPDGTCSWEGVPHASRSIFTPDIETEGGSRLDVSFKPREWLVI